MSRTRAAIAACTLALLAACSGGNTPAKADAGATPDTAANTAANQAPHRPKILQPIDRARTASDSMAARAARMNAATDSIIH